MYATWNIITEESSNTYMGAAWYYLKRVITVRIGRSYWRVLLVGLVATYKTCLLTSNQKVLHGFNSQLGSEVWYSKVASLLLTQSSGKRNWALIIQINSPGFLPEYQAFKLTIPLKSGRCEQVHCPSANIDVHAYKSCMHVHRITIPNVVYVTHMNTVHMMLTCFWREALIRCTSFSTLLFQLRGAPCRKFALRAQVVVGDLVRQEGVHDGTERQAVRPALSEVLYVYVLCVCVCEGENIHKQGLMAEFTIHGSGMEHIGHSASLPNQPTSQIPRLGALSITPKSAT